MLARFESFILPLLYLTYSAKAGFENADDPTGVTLYMTSPACGFYKCSVSWPYGTTQLINWWAPPKGDVRVQLAGVEKTNEDITYDIIKSMPADTTPHCDSGKGIGKSVKGTECGGLLIVVPSSWKIGNYTIVVTSLSHPATQGYTDTVMITDVGAKKNPPKSVQVDVAPTGSSFPSSTSKGKTTTTTKSKPTTTTKSKTTTTTKHKTTTTTKHKTTTTSTKKKTTTTSTKKKTTTSAKSKSTSTTKHSRRVNVEI